MTSSSEKTMPAPHEIERYKSIYEYLKHLVSLSTGSIVILATFLEKILQSQEWRILIILSLLGFLFTVICSTLAYSLLIFDFPGRKTKTKDWENAIGGFALIFSWLGFIIGIISISAFTIKNII